MEELKLLELKEGKDSTEWTITKGLMIGGIVLAVAASLGKVPFTPDQVSAYLANLIKEASRWAEVFAPYMTAIAGWYIHKRTTLKKDYLEAQKEVIEKIVGDKDEN